MTEKIDLSDAAGLPVILDPASLTLTFGDGVTSNSVEQRRIADIRAMLRDPEAEGPDPLYSIYMDVRPSALGRQLADRGLGFGAVVDSPGRIGREYVRSQGHIHSAPAGTNVPYLEIYEIWHGSGQIYLQDRAERSVTAVALVEVGKGDKVIIPPGWVHVVVNTGPTPLAFGALYALDATLIYEPLRKLGGTAWAVLADGTFACNPRYDSAPRPVTVRAREYPEYGIVRSLPILTAFGGQPDRYDYVVSPQDFAGVWSTVIDDLRVTQ